MHDTDYNPLERAFLRCAAEGGGTAETWQVDMDRSTYALGRDDNWWDGAVFASWEAK